MKFDNIEEEVFKGLAAIKKAIAAMRSHKHDSFEHGKKVEAVLENAEEVFKSISPRTLNMIATTETYRMHIKHVKPHGEIPNTKSFVAALISHVEEYTNKSIITAKRSDTKHKRSLEKKIVTTFFKTHKEDLKKMFDLYNLFIEAKKLIK